MTLGGLALAIGILVDEATVEIENIHHKMHGPIDRQGRAAGKQETAVPRLLAMLCILAVFIPSFFMQGAAQALFVPLSLAVGFSMVASYLLSSTFVPVLSVWLLRDPSLDGRHGSTHSFRPGFRCLRPGVVGLVRFRWAFFPAYRFWPGSWSLASATGWGSRFSASPTRDNYGSGSGRRRNSDRRD